MVQLNAEIEALRQQRGSRVSERVALRHVVVALRHGDVLFVIHRRGKQAIAPDESGGRAVAYRDNCAYFA
jgi:hypothetical protein